MALSQGIERWSDLQHGKDLTLTDDALMGVSWRMKKRSVEVPWAALRVGVSGRDWAVLWLKELSNHGLPWEDFIILAPSHDLRSFHSKLPSLPSYHSGFTPSEAMSFSCRSWRLLFPTAGRQLRLGRETVNDMGHSGQNSSIPIVRLSSVFFSTLRKSNGPASLQGRMVNGWPWMCTKPFDS